ncbi:MAG: hypothetical protein ACOC55_04570 [Candidatus Natronoplasma sp.]
MAEYPVKKVMTAEEWSAWKKFNQVIDALNEYEAYNRISELKELAKKLPEGEELERRASNNLYKK